MYTLKSIVTILIIGCCAVANAQKIDSIYVNLYTDSLKKGTYNYINIDGLLPNGRYIPLDSSQISFTSSHGKFYGNSLWLEPDCKEEKVSIHAVLKNNALLRKDFVIYVKRKPDNQQLKTEKQVLEEMKNKSKKA
ncbi:MAG: hypothetical protein H7258_00335 [Ferruginibacter sp.]|nr:hypothetical protein [Ferruginibacter sp.]